MPLIKCTFPRQHTAALALLRSLSILEVFVHNSQNYLSTPIATVTWIVSLLAGCAGERLTEVHTHAVRPRRQHGAFERADWPTGPKALTNSIYPYMPG
eukprot:scaffold62256_cov26-Prasinocladus_malaysianus.AAC.1